MTNRLISANASEILNMTKDELKQSIKASEGRVIVTETISGAHSFIGDITNAELASSFGADLILLNGIDLFNPFVAGLTEDENKDFIKSLHKYSGRPIGANLEPVDNTADMAESRIEIPLGRQANKETFKRANELGLSFICLTGNPGVGVTNNTIINSIKLAKEYFNGLIIAGKMHGAGVNEPVLTKETVHQIVDAGADIIMVPAVGTVPKVRDQDVFYAVDYAHKNGALVMSAIGTSQEGSDPQTIKELAIRAKMAGVDMQHIGDAGYHGLAPVENIYHMSLAIRGIRHTVSRMARSVVR